MPVDPDVHAANHLATERMRSIAGGLADADLGRRVGEHWTPGVVFAHLAFWDRRVQLTLDATEAAAKIVVVDVDVAANDISLPVWLLVPPRDGARLAIETAQRRSTTGWRPSTLGCSSPCTTPCRAGSAATCIAASTSTSWRRRWTGRNLVRQGTCATHTGGTAWTSTAS